MSDAETTIRNAILDGTAKRVVISTEEAVDVIMECVFAEPVRWAVVEYLKELKELA